MSWKKTSILSVITIAIVLALAISLTSSSQAVSARQQGNYKSIEEKILSEGSANVIILPEPGTSKEKSEKARIALETTANYMDGKKELRIINGYSGTLTKKQFLRLKSSGAHYQIFEDRVLTIHPYGETEIITQQDISIPAVGANYSWNILNYTGRNITIAIIDTGINYNHTDLGGCFGSSCRVKDGYDFVNDDSDPIDDNGHGTHVAGIVGANGTLKGVAPEANFYALKACYYNGTCIESDIILALEWATNHGVKIIQMSLGGAASSTYAANSGLDALSIAVDNAVDAGASVVISVGNNGDSISTVNVPGAADKAITVAWSDDHGTVSISDDTISSGSSRGPAAFGRMKPDISAPGENINSPGLGQVFASWSGSSMAAPHVSGAIALMLEQNSSLSPTEIKETLISSASNISGNVYEKGSGLLNIKAAMTQKLKVLVQGSDTYGNDRIRERWETISRITGIESANVTIINYNNFNLTFNLSLDNMNGFEGNISLNRSRISFPSNISILSGANTTFNITFNASMLKEIYANTYGGILHLIASANNTTYNLSVPILISVPFVYTNVSHKSFDLCGENNGNVYIYSYYNPRAGNDTFRINWTYDTDDLDLYVYNSSGIIDEASAGVGYDYEEISSDNTDSIKWIRVHGYACDPGGYPFQINITDNDDLPPNISSISDINGTQDFDIFEGENSTLLISFNDPENTEVSVSINDSRYNYTNLTNSSVTYYYATNNTTVGNYTVLFLLHDEYFKQSSRNVNIIIRSLNDDNPSITSHEPSDINTNITKDNTITFNITAFDPRGRTLYYYWYINDTLNSTTQNFTFESTNYNVNEYNLTIIVSNNNTTSINASNYWNISVQNAPAAPPVVHRSGGSSSGGGGITGDLNYFSETIKQATGNLTINSSSKKISLDSMTVYFEGTQKDMTFKVYQYNESKYPGSLSSFDPSKLKYTAFEINHTNLNSSDVKNVTIKFKVNKTWLKQKNIVKTRIHIYRNYMLEWNKLPTKIISETAQEIFYSSESPGLSIFVIAAENEDTPLKKTDSVDLKIHDNNTGNESINNAYNITNADSVNSTNVSNEDRTKKMKQYDLMVKILAAIIATLAIILAIVIIEKMARKKAIKMNEEFNKQMKEGIAKKKK